VGRDVVGQERSALTPPFANAAKESALAQVETALYANQAFGQAIRRELLLSICRSQVTEMLDDRRLTALEVRKASLDLPKRALHLGNIGADGAKLRQHQVLRTLDHAFQPSETTRLQSAAARCSIAATAGRLAFRNVLMCRTASGIFSGTSFHGYMLTCALGASIADSMATA
jgi:hypothetical protein